MKYGDLEIDPVILIILVGTICWAMVMIFGGCP